MNVSTLAATATGAVFVYAGVAKLLSGREWPRSAARLGVPKVVAVVVMIAEVVVGLGMAVGNALGDSWQRGFLAVGGAMLVAFTALLAGQMRHAERPPCMCFGGASQRPIGARDIVRNVSLLVLVLIAIVP